MIRGIILSSGRSIRMGTQKLLLPLGNHTVIEEVIKNAIQSLVDEILLVYGEPKEIFRDICRRNFIMGLYNEDYTSGQSQSIIKGVGDAKADQDFIFLLGDQPFVTAEVIDAVIMEHRRHPENIIVPVHEGRRGNPVLFPSRYRSDLLGLSGDTGGREIIKNNLSNVREVEITSQYAFLDIDTNLDYNLAKEVMRNEHI